MIVAKASSFPDIQTDFVGLGFIRTSRALKRVQARDEATCTGSIKVLLRNARPNTRRPRIIA